MRGWPTISGRSWAFLGREGGDGGKGDSGHGHRRGEPGTLVSADHSEFPAVWPQGNAPGDPQPLEGGEQSTSREGPQLGWGCPHAGPTWMGEVYDALVNTALNALRLEGWFTPRMSMPIRAKTCAFRHAQTIARLFGQASWLCNRPSLLLGDLATHSDGSVNG